jgi:hypothetical protein
MIAFLIGFMLGGASGMLTLALLVVGRDGSDL